MVSETMTLGMMAMGVAFIHCLCGPDHYVPFVAMSRVGVWSLKKTLWITFVCGLGHIAGSACLGATFLATSITASRLLAVKTFEAWRGDLAAWLLIGVGALFVLYGIWHLRSHARHGHHHHDHSRSLTPWALFVVFVFGPCEPLIPLLLVPAARESWSGVGIVLLLFGATTIMTMLVAVTLLHQGMAVLHWHVIERYSHCLAGSVVMACGALMLCGL